MRSVLCFYRTAAAAAGFRAGSVQCQTELREKGGGGRTVSGAVCGGHSRQSGAFSSPFCCVVWFRLSLGKSGLTLSPVLHKLLQTKISTTVDSWLPPKYKFTTKKWKDLLASPVQKKKKHSRRSLSKILIVCSDFK